MILHLQCDFGLFCNVWSVEAEILVGHISLVENGEKQKNGHGMKNAGRVVRPCLFVNKLCTARGHEVLNREVSAVAEDIPHSNVSVYW